MLETAPQVPKSHDGPITTRPALPSDAVEIARIGATSFTAAFGHSIPAADMAAYLESDFSIAATSATLHSPLMTTIVAVAPDGAITGYAQLREGTTEPCINQRDLPTVELQRLYMSTEWMGKRIGPMLMQRADEIAREMGKKTMWLGVWEENYRAQKVYEKLGYRKVGDHEFVSGECVQTDWILLKYL
ncbi:Acyl-CoA N-acyltransferases (Nat) [Venustampulla echinocandica]|uniref:Acyl-CoA N-acyltransferases (Nat) n=1 Tax=Venustampulla echinocandica TaxID=2656787 RepID=A0A370U412_9HELO|nr:Acyl-CoA N-acyltransferases (Nat) [Venustampulla echinocandica]RDL42515.1 Acyl-CoA N-acyltransferases (Nat) [Venustampulla echinocandica]